MKTAFIIDSSASISEELKNHPDVYVEKLEVTWGNQVYSDTTDEKLMKEFYKQLGESKELPKTSQPKQGDLILSYKDILKKSYDNVIVITLASVLSGTYSTFAMISENFKDQLDIRLIDSKGTSFIEENILKYAIELTDSKVDLDTIEEKLNWIADQSHIYVLIEDLNAIAKGGRLSSMGAFIGAQLKIRPILHFDDKGYVVVFEKLRTTKKVYKRYLELVDEAVKQFPAGFVIALAHGDAQEAALKVKGMIQEKYPDIEFRVGYLTPVLGTHGGKDALGLGIMPKLPS